MEAKEKLIAEITSLLQQAAPTLTKAETIIKSEAFNEIGGSVGNGQGDVSLNANGGGDIIKNKDKKDEKSESLNKQKDCGDMEKEKKSKEDKEKEEKEKLEAEKKSKAEKDEKEKEEKKEDKKEIKKSFDISAEDFEILAKAKAAIAEKEAEEKLKNDPLYKSVNSIVSQLAEKVDSLATKIDSFAKSPAREPKSLNGLQAIKKSENGTDTKTLKKSQVLGIMEGLLRDEKISPEHICEYEASNNIQDARVKELVQEAINKQS